MRKLWPRFQPVELRSANYSPSPILRQQKKSQIMSPIRNQLSPLNHCSSLERPLKSNKRILKPLSPQVSIKLIEPEIHNPIFDIKKYNSTKNMNKLNQDFDFRNVILQGKCRNSPNKSPKVKYLDSMQFLNSTQDIRLPMKKADRENLQKKRYYKGL